ncbi:MAG: hypothetical protein ACRDLB_06785 [Actinomycetota bacterium]
MPKEVLLVANRTAGGSALRDHVRQLMQEGDCHFTLLVPANPSSEHATWSDEEAYALARQTCSAAVQTFAAMGADIEGRVGDTNPFEAIGDALREKHFDQMVLSTLPPGVSKWLHRDLPARIERSYSVPLTTVIGEPEIAHT